MGGQTHENWKWQSSTFKAARPQTSPVRHQAECTTRPRRTGADGQKACHSLSARLAYLASDRPDIAFACKGMQPRSWESNTSRPHKLETYRTFRAPRAVWEFPLHASAQTLLHAPKTRLSTSGGFQTQAYCDDEKPKVPAECLMTGSSNEPASRPDASRNCADHPEAGSRSLSERAGCKDCAAQRPHDE